MVAFFCPAPHFSVRAPLVLEYLGTQTRNTNGTDQTWSGVSLGAADASRRILLAITNAGDANTRTVASTIAGVGGTQIATSGGTAVFSAIHIAHVPTGTTGDIRLLFSANTVNQMVIGIYRVIGMGADAAYDSAGTFGTSPQSISLDVPSGGVVIGAARVSTNTTFSWTGADEGFDLTLSNSVTQTHSGGSRSFVSAVSGHSVSVSSASSPHLCAVSLSP